MKFRIVLIIGAVLSVAVTVTAETINFDDLPVGVTVTNQYAGVEFSSAAGFENRTLGDAGAFGSSAPNHILSAVIGGGLTGLDELIVNFNTQVNDLRFVSTAVNVSGPYGLMEITYGGGLQTQIDVVGDGSPDIADPVDLSAYAGVTRVRIFGLNDPGGVGWDDFSFTQVPEPTLVGGLMLSGLLVFRAHRRGVRPV